MLLVTGATGFLGSELARQLLKEGTTFRATKRHNSFIPPDLIHENIEWVDADILDFFALERAFQGVTKVFHCAAFLSFQSTEGKDVIRTNREGTAHIVNLCLDNNIEKLIHVSSIAALGEAKNHQAVTEKAIWQYDGSQQAYSISKYESEMEVWRGIAEGLNAIIVNPSVIIGKDTRTNGSIQLFNEVKKGLKFYTEGSCAFVDVSDVAKSMILLMNSTSLVNERFIINSENLSYIDFFRLVAKGYSVKPPHIHAKKWMISLGWRLARLASLFTGKKYSLTKETASSASKRMNYSAEKFLKYFPDFKFRPLKESIAEITAYTQK